MINWSNKGDVTLLTSFNDFTPKFKVCPNISNHKPTPKQTTKRLKLEIRIIKRDQVNIATFMENTHVLTNHARRYTFLFFSIAYVPRGACINARRILHCQYSQQSVLHNRKIHMILPIPWLSTCQSLLGTVCCFEVCHACVVQIALEKSQKGYSAYVGFVVQSCVKIVKLQWPHQRSTAYNRH